MSPEVKIEINTIRLYLLFSVKLTKYFLLRISWINCVTPKIKKYSPTKDGFNLEPELK